MVKKISVSKVRVYTPEWEDNLKATPVEQIKVKIKAVTVAMKEKLAPREIALDGDGNPQIVMKLDRKKTLKEMVVGIENLASEDEEGNVTKIVDVDDLFKAGVEFDGLVEELYSECNNAINSKGVDEKN